MPHVENDDISMQQNKKNSQKILLFTCLWLINHFQAVKKRPFLHFFTSLAFKHCSFYQHQRLTRFLTVPLVVSLSGFVSSCESVKWQILNSSLTHDYHLKLKVYCTGFYFPTRNVSAGSVDTGPALCLWVSYYFLLLFILLCSGLANSNLRMTLSDQPSYCTLWCVYSNRRLCSVYFNGTQLFPLFLGTMAATNDCFHYRLIWWLFISSIKWTTKIWKKLITVSRSPKWCLHTVFVQPIVQNPSFTVTGFHKRAANCYI